ncbi:ACT domain-containing protein [Roseovarius sp. MMSF_3281]|uniref:ACT domain-containing protein n=1 Tax=Roseovarius sp. MMSF_3281 TaxID=3046694 RepID=UPI00273DE554|nr:ACT domain-containing protein [Roseovarius sp. MMSF_3281]
MAMALTLRWVPGVYGLARLAPDACLPAWIRGPGFVSLSWADDEVTVICDAAGIVQALIAPLSDNGIGVFVICTFDGEHLLIRQMDKPRAVALLQEAGHRFLPDEG